MKQKIYLETSFISYVTARPSRDLIIAAHQQITREWWDSRKKEFSLFISQLVVDESSQGDTEAASERLEVIKVIPVLELNDLALGLARGFLKSGIIPEKAVEDSIHISLATVHGMDYLLTWNCKHIANASIRNKIAEICHNFGFEIPIICTPEELMEG
jgi:hypothetical protein